MTRTSASTVFGAIKIVVSATDPPRLLHDVVAEQIIALGHTDDLGEALETAEALLEDVKLLVTAHQYESELGGVAWTIELYGSNDEYIRGASSVDRTLTPAEQRARSHRAHASAILGELVRFTPHEFEVASTSILKIMGCTDPHTSPIRNDGGIDFYGRLELRGRLDNPSLYSGFDGRVGVWLVGQAKHYPTRAIQTALLRELVGSVELARTGGAIHEWAGLQLRPFDAVIQLLFTTGSFTSGSAKLLERTGLLSMDGPQLATFLADAGIGISVTELSFDSAQFRRTLGL